jgi:hypothetical protein
MKSRPAANQVPAHCSNNRDEKAGRKFNNEKKIKMSQTFENHKSKLFL